VGRSEGVLARQNVNARRVAVRSIAWLRLSKKGEGMGFCAGEGEWGFDKRFHAAIQAL
jgi:hypothetical protein